MKRVLTDLLLTGVLLVVFALFHHVLPPVFARWRAENNQGPVVTPMAVATPAAVQPKPAAEAASEPEPETEDTRTEWQIRFAEHFTDEVIVTDHSYSSPNVSVDITTCTATDDRGLPLVWYVADIYVGSIDCFQTYLAGGSYSEFVKESVESMSRAVPAIIAINGDYYNTHHNAMIVRNGLWYNDQVPSQDVCVLFRNGEMQNFTKDTLNPEVLKQLDVWQSWCFGPNLLDENGKVLKQFNMSSIVANNLHPRCGLGYYEPGHYCFVLMDGRHNSWSRGMTIPEFAQIFESIGCKAAYNLDGGGSAAIAYRGEIYNHISDGNRDIADILYICEPVEAEP